MFPRNQPGIHVRLGPRTARCELVRHFSVLLVLVRFFLVLRFQNFPGAARCGLRPTGSGAWIPEINDKHEIFIDFRFVCCDVANTRYRGLKRKFKQYTVYQTVYTLAKLDNYKLIKYVCIVNIVNFKEHTILIVS